MLAHGNWATGSDAQANILALCTEFAAKDIDAFSISHRMVYAAHWPAMFQEHADGDPLGLQQGLYLFLASDRPNERGGALSGPDMIAEDGLKGDYITMGIPLPASSLR